MPMSGSNFADQLKLMTRLCGKHMWVARITKTTELSLSLGQSNKVIV